MLPARLKVRWGVLGVAKIATAKVIPGLQKSELCEVVAIASRDAKRARDAAAQLGLPKHYGSYEELLADGEIDAIYNPLPNHLHVPWTVKTAAAGKHVLCEKPIALSAKEAEQLIEAREKYRVKIGEAFMVRTHPQWLRVRELIRSGTIGDVVSVESVFSYFNRDPANIRNRIEMGGGAVMDIGCYPITMSRFFFGREPSRVVSLVERDPAMGVDRFASVLLDFGSGQRCVFTCATQMVPYQSMQVFGTKGRLQLEIPYNTPPNQPSRIYLDDGSKLGGASATVEEFPPVDQYGLQGDAFSAAILEDAEVPVPLEDSIANMRVIEAVLKSGASSHWEPVKQSA